MIWNDFSGSVGAGAGLIGAGIGVLALMRAGNATKIAHDALKLSQDADARATEKHDVYWEGHWTAIGVYALTNMGNDSAHNVKASVTVDDEKVVRCSDEVIGGGTLEFYFPRAEAAGYQEYREKHPNQNSLAMPILAPLHIHLSYERITWETELGQDKIHESTSRFTSLLVH
jgi:hypothetical protein